MRLRTEGVTWQEIDGELVILDLKSSAYLTTNVAGAVLAKQLVDERNADDLADALVAEFAIDRATAAADVEVFLDDLRAKDLLIETAQS